MEKDEDRELGCEFTGDTFSSATAVGTKFEHWRCKSSGEAYRERFPRWRGRQDAYAAGEHAVERARLGARNGGGQHGAEGSMYAGLADGHLQLVVLCGSGGGRSESGSGDGETPGNRRGLGPARTTQSHSGLGWTWWKGTRH